MNFFFIRLVFLAPKKNKGSSDYFIKRPINSCILHGLCQYAELEREGPSDLNMLELLLLLISSPLATVRSVETLTRSENSTSPLAGFD